MGAAAAAAEGRSGRCQVRGQGRGHLLAIQLRDLLFVVIAGTAAGVFRGGACHVK